MLNERSIRLRFAALAVGAFVLLMTLEVWTDEDAFSLGDFLADALQLALLVASAAGVSLLAGRFQQERDEKEALMRDLELARAEGQAWRDSAQSYVSGLGEAIEKQFEKWQLTSAEREVGLLMLKGFSHREVGEPARHHGGDGPAPGAGRLPEVGPARAERVLRLFPRGPAPGPGSRRRRRPGGLRLLRGVVWLLVLSLGLAGAAGADEDEALRDHLTEREDKRRPPEPFTIDVFGHPLTLGGEYEFELNYVRQRVWRATTAPDRLLLEHGLELEAFYTLGAPLSLFAQVQLEQEEDLLSKAPSTTSRTTSSSARRCGSTARTSSALT